VKIGATRANGSETANQVITNKRAQIDSSETSCCE
jgi:hypothetical protein